LKKKTITNVDLFSPFILYFDKENHDLGLGKCERRKLKSMKNAGYVDAGCFLPQRTLVRRLGVADLFGEALLVS